MKKIAWILTALMVIQVVTPTVLYAGKGPTQPEFSSFTAAGTDNLVDLFTGDFQYNIPLLDVGGYPINMSYRSGITMEDEASWVGLGWNLNVGSIKRSMRGIPDDFNGDAIRYEQNLRKNKTAGVSSHASLEVFGFENLSLGVSLGASVNNYYGISYEKGVNLSLRSGKDAKGPLNFNLGITSSTDDGLTVQPSVGLSFKAKGPGSDEKQSFGSLSIGSAYNSRQGLKQISFGSAVLGTGGPSASIDLGTPTYVPSITMPMKNRSYTGAFKLGPEVVGSFTSLGISGYMMDQTLSQKVQNKKSYGYFYIEKGALNENAILDYNREKDGAFTEELPSLPIAGLTYDVFSIQGQGIGGTFRAYRGAHGNVFDARSSSITEGGNLSVEIGSGALAHIGADIVANSVNSTAGKWTSNNLALPRLNYKTHSQDPLVESLYFKEGGELTIDPESALFEAYGGSKPVRAKLLQAGSFNTLADNDLYRPGGNPSSLPLPSMGRSKRIPRGQSIQILSKKQLKAGLGIMDPHPDMYVYDYLGDDPVDDDHIGEIRTVSKDGRRYIYGIPAYNISQKEVTFAVDLNNLSVDVEPDMINGSVAYLHGADNTTNNINGRDHYFSSKTIPPYAHSFLLSCALSPDYEDSDNVKGPSDGDLGQYTLFEYDKKYSGFGWRTPAEKGLANHEPGILADPMDDKGSYVYGTKEIWYLTKVISRDYVAIFTTNDTILDERLDVNHVFEDGGFEDDQGIPNVLKLRKLTQIALYAKNDLNQDLEPIPGQSSPIKTVHFEYSHVLCSNTPTNPTGSGKLTLESVWFTYGDSYRGETSPYTFDYGDVIDTDPLYKIDNPEYGLKSTDRWGNFQPNYDHLSFGDFYQGTEKRLRNEFFPYTHQDKTTADFAAQAWNLKRIELPTGGAIEVDYESDDYAYVQNKQAMRMHHISKVGNDEFYPTLNEWDDQGQEFDGIPGGPDPAPLRNNNFPIKYLTIEGEDGVDAWEYVPDNRIVFLKSYISDFRKDGDFNRADYIAGYFKVIDATGISGEDKRFELQLVSIADNGSDEISPMHLSALQHARLNYSSYIYGVDTDDIITDNEPLGRELLRSILGVFNTEPSIIKDIIEGLNANEAVDAAGFCKDLYYKDSFIRLKVPKKIKYGGGCRVKKVEIHDRWNEMGTAGVLNKHSYGQEYSYITIDPENGATISSGVAAWEPMIGGDENPNKQPVFYNDVKPAAPDDKFYHETPYGELFYPSPTVGYSKVTVKDIVHVDDMDVQDITRHGTGYTINEFYTSKDFPTISERTDLAKDRDQTSFSLLSLFRVNIKDYMTASQGFSIETNDMHGKPKRTEVYQEGGTTAISYEMYKYRSEPYGEGSFRLKNEAITVQSDGTLSMAEIGLDYELVADLRESKTTVLGPGVMVNSDIIPFLTGGLYIPMLLPTISKERTQFRSIAITKVINRSGLLESVTKYDQGAKVIEENLAYDAETGSVLATRTIDQFDKPIYSMRFPAYWYHTSMAPSSRNSGLQLKNISFVDGKAAITDAAKFFTPGDELIVTDNFSVDEYKMWVVEVLPGEIEVIDRVGDPINDITVDLKVYRSGYRNMSDQTMATLTSLSDPLSSWGDNIYDDVVQAESIEFDQGWRTPCECLENGQATASTNPYILGIRGMWRPKRTFAYLTDRQRSDYNKNTDIRTDGTFTGYAPYYKVQNGKWLKSPPGWTFAEEIVEFGAYGQALETRNALELYSASTFGHFGTRQMASAANARYQEIGFASFEDYSVADCHDLHFRFENVILDPDAHSGRNSLLVPAGSESFLQADLVECDPPTCGLVVMIEDIGEEHLLNITGGTQPYSIDYSITSGTLTINLDLIDPNGLRIQGSGEVTLTVSDDDGCELVEFLHF